MKIIVGTTLSAQSLSRIGVWDNRLAYVLGLQALGHEVYLMGDLAEGKCR